MLRLSEISALWKWVGDVEIGLEGELPEDGIGRERRSKHAHLSGGKITLFQVTRIFLSCFPEGYSPEEAIRVHYFGNFKNKSSSSNMIHVFHCQDAQKLKPQNLRFHNQCRPWEWNCVLFPSPQSLSLDGYSKQVRSSVLTEWTYVDLNIEHFKKRQRQENKEYEDTCKRPSFLNPFIHIHNTAESQPIFDIVCTLLKGLSDLPWISTSLQNFQT